MTVEMLLRVLDRMPGASWASRLNPATGEYSWLYVNAKTGEVYDVPEAELRANPMVLMDRIVPEERAQLDELVARSMRNLAPIVWAGRIKRRSGEIRWIETQTVMEREPDGTLIMYGQALDITERKSTETALAASEAARQKAEALYRAVIHELPVGIIVMDPDGNFPIYNAAAERYAGRAPDAHGGDLTHAFGTFEIDGRTPFPNDRLPLVRSLGGEEAPEEEMIVRNRFIDGDCWVHVNGKPIRDASGKIVAGMVAFQDVTHQRMLERELRTRNEQLAASEEAKTGLIERLRLAIDELSNPILEVWDDVLAMPIIGIVDSRRTSDMVQRLLAEVARTQASFVIVDLTGVEVVDTKTADHLMKLIRKVEVVGARCVLTGVRPAVAETLVDIGVDFGRVTTLRNLKHGLREALRFARMERHGVADVSPDDDQHQESQRTRRPSR